VARNLTNEFEGGSIAITTDDLIPMILFVITCAAPQFLYTNLSYMEDFSFLNISATSLGFTLVTFQAAVAYLQSEHLSPTDNGQSKPITKHQAFVPLNETANWNKDNESINKERPKELISPRVQRQETKSNQKETKENKSVSQIPSLKPPPEVIKLNQQDEQLGDFLSKLREETDVTSRVDFRP